MRSSKLVLPKKLTRFGRPFRTFTHSVLEQESQSSTEERMNHMIYLLHRVASNLPTSQSFESLGSDFTREMSAPETSWELGFVQNGSQKAGDELESNLRPVACDFNKRLRFVP